MGIMDKIKNATGNGYDDNYDEDYYYDNFGPEDNGFADGPAMGVGTDNIGGMGTAAMGGISLAGSGTSSLEMKVVKPQQFDCVSQIADHLLAKRTVVLNLENTNKETARRLIDFLSGVAYSIDGSIKKIAANAYVITPNNVDVGDAKLTDDAPKAQSAPEAPQADVFPEF